MATAVILLSSVVTVIGDIHIAFLENTIVVA